MLTIRVFRAIDDLATCERFAAGHAKVLEDYGVTKVTSARNDWFYNPGVYVATVENESGELVGGERVHLSYDGFQLPIESAVSKVDQAIFELVGAYQRRGLTGELCGLWNSKSIAGKGVSLFLTKLGVAIAKRLHMGSLFVLCAPYTVSMCQRAGFVIETSIGNQGTFFYPKLDLVATSLVIPDVATLEHADGVFLRDILALVEERSGVMTESGEKGSLELHYNLSTLTTFVYNE